MASETIVGQLTYFKDNHSDVDSAAYADRESLVEIMKDKDTMYFELALEPDAQARTVDRLYIKLPVHALMIALSNVLMQKEAE